MEKDQDNGMEEVTLLVAQLRAMASELKTGLLGAIQDLSTLKLRDSCLEASMKSYHSDMEEMILDIRNCLNTFKEDLTAVLSQIKDMQWGLELFQMEVGRELSFHRTGSRDDVQADVLRCPLGQPEDSFLQHYLASLVNGSSWRGSSSIPGSSSSGQEAGTPPAQHGMSRSRCRRECGDSRDSTSGQGSQERGKRQKAALVLLESERLYVSYLSLLLKANITFNDSEGIHTKDKRPFPSSLRFLIQQHLELLHILQERVLKYQWRGIMGDVFMRLTSKESDFLDYYVAYLKELPECLSAVNAYSATSLKAAGPFEGDLTGGEKHPPIQTLLLLPVQRVPEYLILLQNLAKQTDSDHPDYYLLLVSIRQLKTFTGQYGHLLQHAEELLVQNQKELKRSATKQLFKTVDCGVQAEEPASPSSASQRHANQVKRSKQKLLEQMQSKRFQVQEAEARCCDSPEVLSPALFFAPDADLRIRSSPLQSIPEKEQESLAMESGPSNHGEPGSALADATGQFVILGGAASLEGLSEDGESTHSASSDSSVDIAFARCPKTQSRGPFRREESQDRAYKYPSLGCASPDEIGITCHHPLQAGQHKSKSLNGLQLDSPIVSDGGGPADFVPTKSQGTHSSDQHTKLERQSSKGFVTCKLPRSTSPLQKHEAETGTATEGELHGDRSKGTGVQPFWAEETRWMGSEEEDGQTAFSERSRRQDQKGGFRNSFKKLFKKKSGSDSKDKVMAKSEPQNYSDREATKMRRVACAGDTGTAV